MLTNVVTNEPYFKVLPKFLSTKLKRDCAIINGITPYIEPFWH